jgi:ribosome-binding protein aMBF1 (putative translation factor)
MKCEVCEKQYKVTLTKIEGLRVCSKCYIELGLSRSPVWHQRRSIQRANVHMNGTAAADPRPYGRLP